MIRNLIAPLRQRLTMAAASPSSSAVVGTHVMGEVARDAAGNSAKLFFPAAERNCEPIAQCLLRLLGAMQPLRVLEVASGSGQHICRFAQLMPRARFVPSEVEPSYRDWWEPGIHQRLRITAHATDAKLPNVELPPLTLDLLQPAEMWPVEPGTFDAVFNANTLHITPEAACEGLLRGAARALKPDGGRLLLYGPFAEHGVLEPESNRNFDASLRQRNPEWGVRDVDKLVAIGKPLGLGLVKIEPMPSNNRILVFEMGRRD